MNNPYPPKTSPKAVRSQVEAMLGAPQPRRRERTEGDTE